MRTLQFCAVFAVALLTAPPERSRSGPREA